MAHEDTPPELRAVQALLNTVDVEAGTDELDTAAGLREWLIREGLLNADEGVSAADLRLAREVRDKLRDLVHDMTHSGGRLAGEAARQASRVTSKLPLRVEFDDTGVPALVPAGTGAAGALAQVVSGIPIAMANGAWQRLKLCPAENCEWAFYDQSRNRSRRWCSMDVCGNRTKTKAFRSRQT
jgi:predicted RNA-binding Zn ribbon-like protein